MLFAFCPVCGKELMNLIDGRFRRRQCGECGYVQYRNPTVGVAVILMEKERILLVKRKGSYAGAWCIPCGHVEWDEDVREAAIREMHEETGLTVELDPVFEALSNFHDEKHHTVGVWFLGKRVSGVLSPGSDAVQAKYFPLDNLPENMAFPTDREICQKLLDSTECP